MTGFQTVHSFVFPSETNKYLIFSDADVKYTSCTLWLQYGFPVVFILNRKKQCPMKAVSSQWSVGTWVFLNQSKYSDTELWKIRMCDVVTHWNISVCLLMACFALIILKTGNQIMLEIPKNNRTRVVHTNKAVFAREKQVAFFRTTLLEV